MGAAQSRGGAVGQPLCAGKAADLFINGGRAPYTTSITLKEDNITTSTRRDTNLSNLPPNVETLVILVTF